MTLDLFGDEVIEDSNFTFEDFWAAYPKGRKSAKPMSEQLWNKLKPDDRALAMADIEYREERDAQWKESKRFIPLSKPYLNQQRWHDDYEDCGTDSGPTIQERMGIDW